MGGLVFSPVTEISVFMGTTYSHVLVHDAHSSTSLKCLPKMQTLCCELKKKGKKAHSASVHLVHKPFPLEFYFD